MEQPPGGRFGTRPCRADYVLVASVSGVGRRGAEAGNGLHLVRLATNSSGFFRWALLRGGNPVEATRLTSLGSLPVAVLWCVHAVGLILLRLPATL
jgi:hypothetical protein